MKINYLLIVPIIFSFLFGNILFSEEIEFEAKKIDIKENGNLVVGYNSTTKIPNNNINIVSDEVYYYKTKNLLIFKNNIKVYDKINNIIIKSNKLNYRKDKNLIFSEGPTDFKVDDKYNITSDSIFYDLALKTIYGNKETIVEDKERNIFKLKEKYNIDLDKEIIKSKRSLILDKDDNTYIFDDLIIDLKKNQIAGKEIKVEFKDSYFGNKDNDPVLKGRSSYSNEKELKVYKAVFSTCDTENKSCRGWELNSDEFKHDKVKKVFEYRNSWLKLFDYRIFFTPYFSHPDPTIKRKSGFLTPSYGSSDSLGTQINFPYFKVISPDKDITFNPRYYADKSFLMQNEYRQALKNSNILSDFSFLIGDAGTKGHLFFNQEGKINQKTNYELNIQNVRGDNYLKTHRLKDNSSIITNDSVLISNLDLDWDFTDSKLSTSFKVYEDLSRNYHDRYQYIFPDFNFSRNINIPENYDGKFTFNSYGYNKYYNTNITESVFTNDFIFSSNEFVNRRGILSNYNILLKNSNDYSNNSLNFDNNLNYNVFGLIKMDISYPLQKKEKIL